MVFVSSRLTGEVAVHRNAALCLYATDGKLYLDCEDGVRLLIGAVLVDGTELDGREFLERYGPVPWRFNSTAET